MHRKFILSMCLCLLTLMSSGCGEKVASLEYQDTQSSEFLIAPAIAKDMESFVPESVLQEVDTALANKAYAEVAAAPVIVTPAYSDKCPARSFCFLQEKTSFELQPLFVGGLDGEYGFLQDGKELFRHQMAYGSDGPIRTLQLVNGKPLLTFATGADPYWLETYYDGVLIGEANKLQGASNVFLYNGKLGFVTKGTTGSYLWHDGQKRSREFDAIIGYGCCTAPYMFSVDQQTGRVEFLARRGEKYYIGVVEL